jgi:hypothetical protein
VSSKVFDFVYTVHRVHLKCNNGNNFLVSSESATAYDWQVNNSSFRGRRRTYLTIFKRAWSADSKMVR